MRGAEGFWPRHTKNVTFVGAYRAWSAVGRPTPHASSEGIWRGGSRAPCSRGVQRDNNLTAMPGGFGPFTLAGSHWWIHSSSGQRIAASRPKGLALGSSHPGSKHRWLPAAHVSCRLNDSRQGPTDLCVCYSLGQRASVTGPIEGHQSPSTRA